MKAQLLGDGVKFHCLLHHMILSLTVGSHVLQTLDLGKVYLSCLSFLSLCGVCPTLASRLYKGHPRC